jgi:ATP phosphoribosyltransferase regulatory subunit
VSELSVLRLPVGMRDFVPGAALGRRTIAEKVLRVFEGWGYARVMTPVFEYEDVLARGLGSAARAAAIRFVEPSSGQVVVLRPDITPQIARLVAGHYRDERGPIRLCYEGSVLRMGRHAHSQRELIQVGIELVGVAGPNGDAEVLTLGQEALAALGQPGATLDIGHLGFAREVIQALRLSPDGEEAVRVAIAKRDQASLRQALKAARGSRAVVAFAARLPSLCGPPSLLGSALRQAPTSGIRGALEDLRQSVRAFTQVAMATGGRVPRLNVDLAEVRGFDYYTGLRVQGFVRGASEPILQGGRYDTLLGRYGHKGPAVGFAIDVEAAATAWESESGAGRADSRLWGGRGTLVTGPATKAWRAVAALRRRGLRATLAPAGRGGARLDAYAAGWRFTDIVRAESRPADPRGREQRRASGGKH